jgi:hypothetical protein
VLRCQPYDCYKLKTIETRVNDSFGDSERGEADQYLTLVMSSWKDISQSINKSAGLSLGFMALFELLISQKELNELEIGSFSFDNTSILQIAIPVVVAYLMFNLGYLGQRWIDHQALNNGLTRRFYPRMAQNNLAHLVRPQLSTFATFGRNIPLRENSRPGDTFSAWVITVFSALTAVFLPIAFEIQAYVHLFHVHGNSDPVLWVSLIISTTLMCCNLILFYMSGKNVVLESKDFPRMYAQLTSRKTVKKSK